MNKIDEKNSEINRLAKELAESLKNQNEYERTIIDLIASDNARPRRNPFAPYYYEGEMTQEGILSHRPYAGAKYHDKIEEVGAQIACSIFGADHANIQPHSCSQANQAVYFGLLEPNDTVLSLDFKAGGHLTHGKKMNFSGKIFIFHFYGTDESGLIDYAEARRIAIKVRPRLILCGSSAYPRNYNYSALRGIADEVGAYLMCDIAHEAGLIAAGVMENPVPLADVATMSLDKTMRGVSSAMILCKKGLASKIDKGVHPGTQSSFPIRRLAETAATLLDTQTDLFRDYARQTLANARCLADRLQKAGFVLVTNGTDKHLIVLDVFRTNGMLGASAEKLLESVGILTNRQMVPLDKSSRFSDSGGLRLGSAWATSRGYGISDFMELADITSSLLLNPEDKKVLTDTSDRVRRLVKQDRLGDVWKLP